VTDNHDESLSLAAVKQRFLESEEKLIEIAEATKQISETSTLLNSSLKSILEGAESLSGTADELTKYIAALSDISGKLAQATEAIQRNIDPALTQKRLDNLKESIEGLRKSHDESKENLRILEASQKETNRWHDRLWIVLLVLGALNLATLAAVLIPFITR